VASIRQQGSRFEIRECLDTERGPRQRVLARFDRILTDEALEQAAAHARRPFDRSKLVARARARGIPVAPAPRSEPARRLLACLRRGGEIDPTIVGLLQEALGERESRPLPEHLEPAAEWLGASEAARGAALRGLLRTASRIAKSRGPLREHGELRFPRIDTVRAAS